MVLILTRMAAIVVITSLFCTSVWSLGIEECTTKVIAWQSAEIEAMSSKPVQHDGKVKPKLLPLLFFLHIPRTGGRTYHQCFLKSLYQPSERCKKSYDFLRMDPKNPECKLLSTHNDFSLSKQLPMNQTSIITNFRDPVDRTLSAYEFAIENAARTLRLVQNMNITADNALKMLKDKREQRMLKNSKARQTETSAVWPWTHIVPFMENDLWNRKFGKHGPYPKGKGPYNSPRLTIPFLDFIRHPMMADILHNGGTFQVTGLTNYSLNPEAKTIRQCAQEHRSLGEKVLQVAKMNLDRMLYVGLTEKHDESARLFCHVIGRSSLTPAYTVTMGGQGFRAQQRNAVSDLEDRLNAKSSSLASLNPKVRRRVIQDQLRKQIGGTSLLRHYHKCVRSQRSRYEVKRSSALRLLHPLSLTKEDRKSIPTEILDELRAVNALDVALYDYAKGIFYREQALYGADPDGLEEEELPMTTAESPGKPWSAMAGRNGSVGVQGTPLLQITEQHTNDQKVMADVEEKESLEAILLKADVDPNKVNEVGSDSVSEKATEKVSETEEGLKATTAEGVDRERDLRSDAGSNDGLNSFLYWSSFRSALWSSLAVGVGLYACSRVRQGRNRKVNKQARSKHGTNLH